MANEEERRQKTLIINIAVLTKDTKIIFYMT